MRSFGVYAKRGRERTQEQVLEKAWTLREPRQNKLTTDVWDPAPDSDRMYVNMLELNTRECDNWPLMIEWLHDPRSSAAEHLRRRRRTAITRRSTHGERQPSP